MGCMLKATAVKFVSNQITLFANLLYFTFRVAKSSGMQ